MKGLRAAVVVAVSSMGVAGLYGDVKLGSMFQDHMVLQRDQAVPVWGKADPGEEVVVTIAQQSKRVTADEMGQWMVKLDSMSAGGPWAMEVKGKNTVKLQDVLVGEVWVCSGQSNMEWPLSAARDGEKEVAQAKYPKVRLFLVTKNGAAEPVTTVDAKWQECTPETAKNFSAVGYFFGREIHQKLDVPVGLIGTYWGGTPAESWTPVEELAKSPETKPIVDRWEEERKTYPQRKADFDAKMAEWKKLSETEPENKGLAAGWAKPEFDAGAWPVMKEPVFWQRAGLSHNGTVWLRKEIDVSAEWAGKDLTLELGRIDDRDVSYFNGVEVGRTWKGNPWAVFVKRKYAVPGKLVKAGKNVVAVRIWDTGGDGGMAGEAGEMRVRSVSEPGEPISLAGEWKYQIEQAVMIPPQPQEPRGPTSAWTPGTLWNGMIKPLIPYGIRGAIWYQGESNADRAEQYRTLFPMMIESWRKNWVAAAEPAVRAGALPDKPAATGVDFPFLFVQLANFSGWKADPTEPADSNWAELREAQLMTLRLPNTAMASAADIGEAGDIHPKNKQEVGRRLALAALAMTYGKQELAFVGPMLSSSRVDNGRMRLRFRPGAERLEAKGELGGFEIAGEDHKFHWAKAAIDGNDEVVVWSDQVKQPVAVRYGWADNPKLTLYNTAGLPASPFRTDSWQGATSGKR